MEDLHNIAVLIDADNTQLSRLESLLHEVSAYGRIVVKKAYGNWKKPELKNWEAEVKRLAIKTEQQFDYVSGKNTTDIALTIDALDLLHENMYDAFVLVSSDSDFTPLAIRLRESGAYIIGAGEGKTPIAFKNACDDFILVEYLTQTNSSNRGRKNRGDNAAQEERIYQQTKKSQPVEEEDADDSDIEEIHALLQIASKKYQDDDGFVNAAIAGSYIKRAKPDFTSYSYGYSKLSELLRAFPDRYKVKKISNGRSSNV